jgi:hypothetical protein
MMKTTASTNSPATAFSAAGIGLRRRFGAFGAGDFAGGADFGAAPGVAGTSALIGRVIGGNANAWPAHPGWLVGQLSFLKRLTDQSINDENEQLRIDEGDGWISH